MKARMTSTATAVFVVIAALAAHVQATDITPVTPPPPGSFPATSSPSVCNQLWEVHPETTDTCESIAAASGLTVPALLALNSGLDCSALSPGQLVCTANSKETWCGDSTYTTTAGNTCNLVRTMFGLADSLLASVNPTLACGDGTVTLPTGTKICIPATLPSSATTTAAGCPPSYTTVVTVSDFLGGCSALASRMGLTVPQMTQLNPQLLDTAGVCVPIVNTVVCKGCTGTVCGLALSPSMKAFLNTPTLNQHFCTILAECSGLTITKIGTAGTAGETVVITATAFTPALQAAATAGHAPIGTFFGTDGTLATFPGSTLQLRISPNYYSTAGSATSIALLESVATLEVPTAGRKLHATIRTTQSQNPAKSTSYYGSGGYTGK